MDNYLSTSSVWMGMLTEVLIEGIPRFWTITMSMDQPSHRGGLYGIWVIMGWGPCALRFFCTLSILDFSAFMSSFIFPLGVFNVYFLPSYLLSAPGQAEP